MENFLWTFSVFHSPWPCSRPLGRVGLPTTITLFVILLLIIHHIFILIILIIIIIIIIIDQRYELSFYLSEEVSSHVFNWACCGKLSKRLRVSSRPCGSYHQYHTRHLQFLLMLMLMLINIIIIKTPPTIRQELLPV